MNDVKVSPGNGAVWATFRPRVRAPRASGETPACAGACLRVSCARRQRKRDEKRAVVPAEESTSKYRNTPNGAQIDMISQTPNEMRQRSIAC